MKIVYAEDDRKYVFQNEKTVLLICEFYYYVYQVFDELFEVDVFTFICLHFKLLPYTLGRH